MIYVCKKHFQAGNLAKLLAPADRDMESGRTRPAKNFIKEFKRDKNIRLGITVISPFSRLRGRG